MMGGNLKSPAITRNKIFCGQNVAFLPNHKVFRVKMYLKSNIRYILTQNTLWIGKKATFLTQNILLRVIAGLFRFPTIIIRKNDKKYNFTVGAKLGRNRFSHSKTPKYAKNWQFWAIFSIFLFLRSTFFTLGIKKSPFCFSNVA